MIAYILSFVGIAICICILWIIYSAHRAEERKDKAFAARWNKDYEGYYAYLRRKREREGKNMMENVKKNERRRNHI